MSRASLERELKLTVPGTAVLAVDDLVRRHGLTSQQTEAALRIAGHSYVDSAGVPLVGEDDPTIELELDAVAQALSRHDPCWRDGDSGSSWRKS